MGAQNANVVWTNLLNLDKKQQQKHSTVHSVTCWFMARILMTNKHSLDMNEGAFSLLEMSFLILIRNM